MWGEEINNGAEETLTVPFLKSFIESQHRAFVQLQLTAAFLMTGLTVSLGTWAWLNFTDDRPVIGWICAVVAGVTVATIVGWIVLLVQRTTLVREVVAAPVEPFEEE